MRIKSLLDKKVFTVKVIGWLRVFPIIAIVCLGFLIGLIWIPLRDGIHIAESVLHKLTRR